NRRRHHEVRVTICLTIGHFPSWSFTGHCVIGHWSFIGHWSLLFGCAVRAFTLAIAPDDAVAGDSAGGTGEFLRSLCRSGADRSEQAGTDPARLQPAFGGERPPFSLRFLLPEYTSLRADQSYLAPGRGTGLSGFRTGHQRGHR